MRQLLIVAAVATAGLGILWANPQERGGPTPAAATTGDEAGVRAMLEAYAAAIKSGDLTAIMNHWAPDADFTTESGEVVKGRDGIGKLYADNLADLKAGKSAVKIEALRFLSPDVAALEGKIEFTPAGGAAETNRFSAVLARKGNRWMIASARDLPETTGQAAERYVSGLQWLAGEWSATDRDTSVKLTVKPDLDGKFAFCRFEIKNPRQSITIVKVIGFDPLEGALRSWTFDSRGGFGESAWERDGGVWVGNTVVTLATGQSGTCVNSIQMMGPNQFKWRSESREVDGQPLPDTELIYNRVGASR